MHWRLAILALESLAQRTYEPTFAAVLPRLPCMLKEMLAAEMMFELDNSWASATRYYQTRSGNLSPLQLRDRSQAPSLYLGMFMLIPLILSVRTAMFASERQNSACTRRIAMYTDQHAKPAPTIKNY